jgi:hypothetical protein
LKKQWLFTLLLVLTLVLSACASVDLVTPDTSGSTLPAQSSTTSVDITPAITTEITPTPGSCASVWASQDLPDLSQKVNQALHGVDPNITGNAYAYGENCVYADGQGTFTAMETDFRVKVVVADLKDENALGTWIARVMAVITKLPPGDLSGPQPGRVEFNFDQGETENLNLKVSIAKYQKLAPGTSGADLFRLFNNNP